MARAHRKGSYERPADQGGSERTCLVHKATKRPDDMIRFVLDPEGVVVPDLKANLPGRGVWITANKSDVDFAARKALFSRGFKSPAKTDEGLAERVEGVLETAALQSLSLAAKAGLVTLGFEKVNALVGKKELRAVLFATDGAEDGIGKIKTKVQRQPNGGDVTIQRCLRSEQMALAFGRANVIHAALSKGGITELCLKNLRRLDVYRADASKQIDQCDK